MNELSDNQILIEIKKGNKDAFRELYSRYEKILLSHIFRMIRNDEVSKELFQEVIITIFEKLNFYTERKDLQNSLKSWCLKIATNKTIDYMRLQKRKPELQKEKHSASLEEEYELKEQQAIISSSMDKLPKMQKLFLSLRVEQELSLKEIAIICECNLNTVKQGLFRARKTLSTIIKMEDVL